MQGGRLDYRCKCLQVVNPLLLTEALSNKLGLIPHHFSIWPALFLENKPAANNVQDVRQGIYEFPGPSFLNCCEFFQDGSTPFLMFRPRHGFVKRRGIREFEIEVVCGIYNMCTIEYEIIYVI